MSFNQPSFLTKQNTLPKKDGKFENNEWAKEKNPQLVEIVRKLISDVSVLKNTTTQHVPPDQFQIIEKHNKSKLNVIVQKEITV